MTPVGQRNNMNYAISLYLNSGLKTEVIIGIVVAGVVAIAGLILIGVYVCRRRSASTGRNRGHTSTGHDRGHVNDGVVADSGVVASAPPASIEPTPSYSHVARGHLYGTRYA